MSGRWSVSRCPIYFLTHFCIILTCYTWDDLSLQCETLSVPSLCYLHPPRIFIQHYSPFVRRLAPLIMDRFDIFKYIYIYIYCFHFIQTLQSECTPFKNICVTNNHGYVPLVVIIILSCPHSKDV